MTKIITFYSFKGGVGRSMGLANTACLLAKSGKKVLMIDWDLEAPGLHKYFKKYLPDNHEQHVGVIDFFIRSKKKLGKIPFQDENETKIVNFLPCFEEYLQCLSIYDGNLYLAQAGKLNESYSKKVDKFNWKTFFLRLPSFFNYFVEYITQKFDYVLIDSRTGYTDMGGICTMLLPDYLVLMFAPNMQNIEGVIEVGKKAMWYRRSSADMRSLYIYPLPSRIETQEHELRDEWETKYKNAFAQFYTDLYGLYNLNLDKYFNIIKISHYSFYAYGEEIAVLREENIDSVDTMANAYNRFFVQLTTNAQPIWDANKTLFRVTIVGTQANSSECSDLQKQLKIFERSNDIYFSTNFIPLERWDDITQRSINSELSKPNPENLFFYLISADLLHTEWFQKLNETNCVAIILPELRITQEGKEIIKSLRNKKIPIITSLQTNRESAWLELMEQTQNHLTLLSYTQKKTN